MSQNDFNIANQGFPSFRSDLNSALQALASNSAGTSAPSTTYAYMWWYDSTNDILKFRNADNDAWINFATFDQAADAWSFANDLDVVGTVSATGGYVETGIDSTSTNAVFTAYRAGEGLETGNFVRLRTAGDGAGNATQLIFDTNSSEAMRIDSSGNLLVGKTTDNITVVGAQIQADGALLGTRANGQPMTLNRTSSDGDIVQFRKDGTTVGSIGNSHSSGHIGIFSPSSGIGCYSSGIYPINGAGNASDNSKDLGALSVRWDDVYATNGTIQTSDRNEKQDIAELDEAEKRVAVAAKGLIRKYRWKDAVAEKGDDARIHVGIVAQDLQAAFAAEGLDAGRYAMFISSTWWEADEVIPAVDEVLDAEGNVVTEAQPERTVTHHYETAEEAPEGATARTRLGVRYPELLAFIIGAL